MKILAICKRAPQQRDLIARPYGRFHHLPAVLAAQGHAVRVLLPDVRRGPEVRSRTAGVDWRASSLATEPLHPLAWLDADAEVFRPDWVLGFSDTWCGWLAARTARRTGARLLLDAYDDYESYMPWNLPLHWLWRRALRTADVVTAAGPQLAAKLDRHRAGRNATKVLPMAADPAFRPMAREQCRQRLQLPADAPLLGYFGGWGEVRGSQLLLDAFDRVRSIRPEVRLVLSGTPPAEVAGHPGVIALGYLPDEDIPVALNAVDVACIVSADTPFGRGSYPSKLCEAMACSVPVVASATGPIGWMLARYPDRVVPVGDAPAFAAKLAASLDLGRIDYGLLPDWSAIGLDLERLLRQGAA